MIDIAKHKDAILHYVINKTEEANAMDIEVFYSDIENHTQVPYRFIEEILTILQNDGFISEAQFYIGNNHANLTVNCIAAYDFIEMGGYKAKQLINSLNLEKLDLELKKLQKEIGPDAFQKATLIAEFASNISTIVTSVKSLFT